MNYTEYIESNPDIMLGKPVIRGTRITVELIIQKLSEGASHQQLLEALSYFDCKRYSGSISIRVGGYFQ